MTPDDVDAVVFDLGGVLFDWDPRHLYRKLFEDEAAMERFLAEVCTQSWNERQDAGRSFDDGVAELVARFPDQAHLIEAYHHRWSEMIAGPIAPSVRLLRELHDRGVPLYALTNWSTDKFPVAERHGFMACFDGVVVSGREGVIKPDLAIFRVLLERFGLTPRGTVFIDDSRRNVDAAAGLGLTAIHFRSPAQLEAELAKLGLIER